jgi:GMP synthase-like glutamine amidotransferase
VDFAKQVLEHPRVRAIGVCYGHQIIGRALGAPVGRSNVGWEVSVIPVDLSEEGKRLIKQDKLVRLNLLDEKS